MDVSSLRERLVRFNQEHLLQCWDELNAEKQKVLYEDISSIDLEQLTADFRRATEQTSSHAKIDDRLLPIPDEACGSISRMKSEEKKRHWETGLRTIAEGKAAALLLAGGQGTRLGVPYPKGMYNVDLPSQKTLYQLQAERLLKLQELAFELTGKKGVIPWYIMTSEYTKDKTEEFFKQHNYFGLEAENVVLFEQRMLPCFYFDGRLILGEKHQVARAPDGNGGLYRALSSCDVISDMQRRGVTCMHVYCVDNILVKIADPVFIGFCQEQNADCGAKVVRKVEPTEAVGVICLLDGHNEVVEYSEITLATAEKRRENGQLLFNAGNICNHYFTTDFVDAVARDHDSELLHHVARKKIPFINEKGDHVKPTANNGIKLEKFVFDVFRFSKQFAVLEVLREDEFSPLKNGPTKDTDCPASCRASLLSMHHRWVVAAGGSFVDATGTAIPLIPLRRSSCSYQSDIECEISPLVSYSGEGLQDLVSDKVFQGPIRIEPDGVHGCAEENGSSPQAKRRRKD